MGAGTLIISEGTMRLESWSWGVRTFERSDADVQSLADQLEGVAALDGVCLGVNVTVCPA